MKVYTRGEGDLEAAVVYCTHGDETSGKQAVERLLNADHEFESGVKFLFANERAYEKGSRYVDADLNRSFPGDVNSDNYEERLAAKMMQELQELETLDLHESESSPTPFALFTGFDESIRATLMDVGLEKAVEISYTPGCGIYNYGGVEVETGPKGTKTAVDKAYEALEQFLINTDVLKGDKNRTKPEIYAVYSQEPKPEGDWQLSAENFEQIGAGDTLARSETGEMDDEIQAPETFTPVLMSDGYDDIFGFKSVRLEELEDGLFTPD